MYNLLMMFDDAQEFWEKHQTGTADFPLKRVFEYTDSDIAQKYSKEYNTPDFDALKEFPCLFTYEGHSVTGTIGIIRSAKMQNEFIKLTYTLQSEYPKIPMNQDQIFRRLGISDGFERSRTYWAVKDIDLFQYVTRMLYEKSESQVSLSHGEMKNLWGSNYYGKKLIFLSHKARDRSKVSGIKQILEKENARCFVAHDDITPGSLWQNEIVKALNTMDMFIGFVTDIFHQGSWTDQEIGYAYRRDVPRMFVKLENTDPKGFMSSEQALKSSWDDAPDVIIGYLTDENLI